MNTEHQKLSSEYLINLFFNWIFHDLNKTILDCILLSQWIFLKYFNYVYIAPGEVLKRSFAVVSAQRQKDTSRHAKWGPSLRCNSWQRAECDPDSPLFARSMAVSLPIPVLAPVMTTVLSCSLSAEDHAGRKKFLRYWETSYFTDSTSRMGVTPFLQNYMLVSQN